MDFAGINYLAVVVAAVVSFFVGWPWYMTLYREHTTETAIGDASTSYCGTGLYPNLMRRICMHVPDAKIIYCVRHPLERMESALG